MTQNVLQPSGQARRESLCASRSSETATEYASATVRAFWGGSGLGTDGTSGPNEAQTNREAGTACSAEGWNGLGDHRCMTTAVESCQTSKRGRNLGHSSLFGETVSAASQEGCTESVRGSSPHRCPPHDVECGQSGDR